MRVPGIIYVSIFLVIISATVWSSAVGKHATGRQRNARIVNGEAVEPHALPYMVAIRTNIDDRDVICGGSLITNSLVLTTAKCVSGASEAEVTLGAHDLNVAEDSQIQLLSSAFIIHEEYKNDSMLHDIALIELPSAVTLNENITTIILPEIGDILTNYNDKLGFIAGWGKTKDTDVTNSNVLHAINVTIIPTLICQVSYLFSLTEDQMCTSGVSQKNICLGDSGSPLLVDGVQVGIASYGSDFGCESGFPGVYTRITSYLSWLLFKIDTYGEEDNLYRK